MISGTLEESDGGGEAQGPSRNGTDMLRLKNIACLFLDLGGTLVSMDFAWLCDELEQRGFACTAHDLERAEAAARPLTSRGLKHFEARENLDVFRFFMRNVLRGVSSIGARGEGALDELIAELTPVLRAPGQTHRLWSRVLPGAREALEALRDAGLDMVVVSNSDGSAEEILVRQGLRGFVRAVVDSHIIGIEKPDRGIFAHALSLVDADASETLHVGDIYDVDVVGARDAGLHAMLIDPYGDWPDVDCRRIASVSDLARLILEA